MSKFEERYGMVEDERVREFHRKRRMYCVHNSELIIAEPNLPYSHAVWFEKEGWMSEDDDKLMDEIVRGIVDGGGDVYFYVGYDFQVNERAESIFFRHLPKLVSRLGLDHYDNIYWGMIKDESINVFVPRKHFGKIGDNLV